MAKVLNVLHYPQKADGYCLAACVQMVLAYQGLERPQDDLAHELRLKPLVGVSASNLARLRSPLLEIQYGKGGTLEDIETYLAAATPVIALVQAGEMPHWRGHRSQHAIVIVGDDAENVYILDPAADAKAIGISKAEFLLAWDEMDNRYAVITRRQDKNN